jgi:hypothetical protein
MTTGPTALSLALIAILAAILITVVYQRRHAREDNGRANWYDVRYIGVRLAFGLAVLAVIGLVRRFAN